MDKLERAVSVYHDAYTKHLSDELEGLVYATKPWQELDDNNRMLAKEAMQLAIAEYEKPDEPVVYRAVWFGNSCCTSFGSLSWFIPVSGGTWGYYPENRAMLRPDEQIKGNINLPATLDAAGLKWRVREGAEDELEVIDEDMKTPKNPTNYQPSR